jgi:hypothetical protein
MAFTAGVKLTQLRGAGEHGAAMEARAATVTTVAQTISFKPFKLSNPTNAMVFRDAGPNDTAGALTVVSIDANGITFTPASTGQVGLLIVGELEMA